MTSTEYINHILKTLEMPLWGKWELKDLICASPDSAVFGLESRRMNRTETAVLKIVPLVATKAYVSEEQKLAQINKAKESAERESDLLFKLQSCPNIAAYLDEDMLRIETDGQFDGYAYLIRMEALERIADSIRANHFVCDEESVLRLAKEITQALHFAHSLGITHRNIQPDRIFLSPAGIAKLGGFHPPKRSGALRAFSDSDAYIAPEVFAAKRAREYTPQADIYSLGICLYQLMNGMNLPFESECDADEAWEKRMSGEPFPQPSGASDLFSQIILKACAFAPEDRYDSAEELLAALLFPEQTARQTVPVPEESEEAEESAEEEAPASVQDEPAEEEPERTGEEEQTAEESEEAEESAEEETAASVQDELTEEEPERTGEEEQAAEETEEAEESAEEEAPASVQDEPAEEEPARTGEEEQTAEESEEAEESAEEEAAASVQDEPAEEEPEEAAAAERAMPDADEADLQNDEEIADPTELFKYIDEQINAPKEENDPAAYVVQNGTLIRYRGIAQIIHVPKGVSVIGSTAFSNCTSVQRVTLPEGVTAIEDMAFLNCTGLKNVQFPASLSVIGNQAFQNCTALQDAEFHGALSQIGTSVFEGCAALRSVILDCPVKNIGFDVFTGCSSLEKIEVSKDSYSYQSVDGVLFDYECKYLLRYPAGRPEPDYAVPESVVTVDDGAFSGSGTLVRVKLTKNVKRIGASAFRDCTKLREVILPVNLETIKTAAFQGCTSLKHITLPTWTTYIGTYAFSRCEQLSSVQLPAKMTELCTGLFEYCRSLSQIRLPDTVVKIGEKAFRESGLTELFVPFSATKIEKQAFANCKKLRYIFLSNRIGQIAPNAFDGCRVGLTVYGMQRSLPEEFARSKNFKFELAFTTVTDMTSCELRKYSGVFAHVMIPPEVNIVCERAFYECKTMRSLDIPASVGEIQDFAFAGCENLSSVTMTNLIMRIGAHAFENCPELDEFHVTDMSQKYPTKVQRKIHRNFYKVLQTLHPASAEEYAKQNNVAAKSTFLDMPFSRQIKKESQEHIHRLAAEYETTRFMERLLQLVADEMQVSERKMLRIELFSDSIIITGMKAGRQAQKKSVYDNLGVGVRSLPDINHILACATVIVRALGSDFALSQNKDSALIRPSIK